MLDNLITETIDDMGIVCDPTPKGIIAGSTVQGIGLRENPKDGVIFIIAGSGECGGSCVCEACISYLDGRLNFF